MKQPLDPRRLETFRVVATTGRVSAAARLLHLSQPAVTAQLRQLEAECGQPLFERTPRGVTLNAAGQALLVYAQRVRQLLDEATSLARAEAEPGGELVLAASTTVAASVLPGLMAAFLKAHRGTGARLEVGNTGQVLAWVREGHVPLGLVEGPGRAAGVRLERFVDDELVAVVAAEAPPELLRVRRVTELEGVPLIWREPGSGTRAVVERALREAGSRRRSRAGDLQLGGTEAIKAAALTGLGVAFLSRWSVQAELASGRLRHLPLKDVRMWRAFSWALASDEPSGVAGRFLRFARENPPRLER